MQHRHLTISEREGIFKMMVEGENVSATAEATGRSKSTVSRELTRHSVNGYYSPFQAQVRADSRRWLSKDPWKMNDRRIAAYVKQALKQYWSPEQIAGRLEVDYPDNPEMRISHECIYAWIRRDNESGGKWYKYLRQSNRKRRKRYGSEEKRGRIVNRVGIEERPAVVDRRDRIGDWENDTLEGAKGCGHVAAHVERLTRFTLLAKLPDKKAESLNRATRRIFDRNAQIPLLTMTVDNGKEFALHEELGEALDVDVYFARPYHAWERGLSENTNGLLRQFIPKGMDLRKVSHQYVAKIEKLLNNRPRKCLGYRTPLEVLNKGEPVAFQT